MKVILGTYTREKSQGIYQIEIKDGKMENLKLLAQAQNPTYLYFDEKESRLFSVDQNKNLAGIAIWNYIGGELIKKQSIHQEGNPPCYVYYDQDIDRIFDANYHLGKVNVYTSDSIDKTFDYGDKAKAHFVQRNPYDQHFYVCDLGKDQVHRYDKKLNLLKTVQLTQGYGPRHCAFHSNNFIYVFNELANIISVLDDELNVVQEISSLENPNTQSSGAAIRISNNYKDLYVSNRGEDSIAHFKIRDNGLIEHQNSYSSFGQHPRDFALSPDNRYLICANRDTHNLTLYQRNDNGSLKLLQKDFYAPEVVNVLFIP